MALIICPECGKEISDKSTVCIHCGCPIQQAPVADICVINGVAYDMNFILRHVNNYLAAETQHEKVKFKSILCCSGIEPCTVGALLRQVEQTLIIPREFNYKDPMDYRSTPEEIRCPKCKSTQITTGSRGYSLVWGFVGSNKTTNRCAKCGYSWQPKR